jgi:curved DNA-binding protein CbpA
MIDAYQILGVNESAGFEEIQSAYRREVLLHHPDRGGEIEDFLSVKKAFDLLSDENKRELLGNQKRFENLSKAYKESLKPNYNSKAQLDLSDIFLRGILVSVHV